MQHFIHKVRFVGLALVAVFVLEMLPASPLHAELVVRVDNVRVEKSASQIIILYDLVGDKSETYNVSVSLRREDAPDFEFTPESLRGDVGDGVLAGADKKVTWDLHGDLPQGLQGSDFYVVVDAALVSTGVGPLVLIGGGVAAAALTALLIFGKKSSEETPPVVTSTFPAEPGRPR